MENQAKIDKETALEEGDKAAERFEKALIKISDSKAKLGVKIDKMTELLKSSTKTWEAKGDERVLGLMGISIGAEVEDIVVQEIDAIQLGEENSAQKKALLVALLNEIMSIHWLAEGFKSSIKVKVAFAIADLKV